MCAEILAFVAIYSFGVGVWVADCVHARRVRRITDEYDERIVTMQGGSST